MSKLSVANIRPYRRSWFFKFSSILIAAVISTCLLITAVSAEDWEEVEVTDPRVLFCASANTDGTLIELTVGTSGPQIVYYPDMAWFCLTQQIPIYSDCTYEIEFTISEIWNYFWSSPIEYTFNVTQEVPDNLGDLTEQRNTAGERYIDTVHYTIDDYNDGLLTTKFSFSTASGFIDNLRYGKYYVTFSELIMPYEGSDWYDWTEEHYWCDITSISVKCIMDPGAGYFTDKVIEDLSNKAAALDEVGSALSESETFLLNKSKDLRSSVQEDMQNMLGEANSFVTPVRSTSSILSSTKVFTNLYTAFVARLPSYFYSLITVVPLLAFIAWLIGRKE